MKLRFLLKIALSVIAIFGFSALTAMAFSNLSTTGGSGTGGSSGSTPSLQAVTDVGHTTTNNITLTGAAPVISGTAGELRISTPSNLRLFSSGGSSVIVRDATDSSNLFEVDAPGNGIIRNNFLPFFDDISDLGSPTKSWRNIYATSSLIFDGYNPIINSTSSNGLRLQNGGTDFLSAGSDGRIFLNNSIDLFAQVNFSGTAPVGTGTNGLFTDWLYVGSVADSNTYFGSIGEMEVGDSGAGNNLGNFIGTQGAAFLDTGLAFTTVSSTIGVQGDAGIVGLGRITTSTAIQGQVTVSGGTITNAVALHAKAISTSGGTITNAYGLLVDPPGFGTSTWTAAIGTGNSYIAGSVTIGSTAAPTSTLDVIGTSKLTGAVTSTGRVYLLGIPSGALGTTDDLVCWDATGGVVSELSHQTLNCTVSSIRFKEHVESLSSKELMEEVRNLRAVSFDYKERLGTLGTPHDEGFIAEEVAMIDPYLVSWEEADPKDLELVRSFYPDVPRLKDGNWLIPRTVDYAKVSMLLVGAVQDEDARITALENRIGLLQRSIKWIERLLKK